jgi:IclR family acetate operon transcriptional repressor
MTGGSATSRTPRREARSLERGLTVLLAVSDRAPVSVDQLVRHLGIPASTLYRYLRPLRDLGIVAESGGMYRVGDRLQSNHGVPTDVLSYLVTPALRALAHESRETALLTVRMGMSALCVAQVESPNHIRMAFEVGQVLPLQAGAGSRVLLAYAPPEVIAAAVAGPLPSYTAATPDGDKLLRQLDSIRALGFATSRGEFIPGAFAIAVPVFQNGSAVAGLVIAGPANRCTHVWQKRARPLLLETGQELSTSLDTIPVGYARF